MPPVIVSTFVETSVMLSEVVPSDLVLSAEPVSSAVPVPLSGSFVESTPLASEF